MMLSSPEESSAPTPQAGASATPRTDAARLLAPRVNPPAIMDLVPFGNVVTANFARTLEREADHWQEEARRYCGNADYWSEQLTAANARIAELDRDNKALLESLDFASKATVEMAGKAGRAVPLPVATSLAEAWGMNQPWPAPDVLERLATAGEHLIEGHGCDQHGYEAVIECARRAREYAAKARHALAAWAKWRETEGGSVS